MIKKQTKKLEHLARRSVNCSKHKLCTKLNNSKTTQQQQQKGGKSNNNDNNTKDEVPTNNGGIRINERKDELKKVMMNMNG